MDLERLDAQLAGTRFAGRGRFHASVTSTNDALQELARGGAREGAFVLAEEQTAGRGRHGRSWISRRGLGLYLSVLFRPATAVPTRWTIAAGIAACDACRAAGAEDTTIHWPNDLFSSERKLGGILVETRSSGTTLRDLVVGLGINVHHDEADLRGLVFPGATSLRREVGSGILVGRESVAAGFMTRLDALVTSLEAGEWEALAAGWSERSPQAAGSAVRVEPAAGTAWSGVTDGLAPDGALRVRRSSGEIHEIRQVDSVRFIKEA